MRYAIPLGKQQNAWTPAGLVIIEGEKAFEKIGSVFVLDISGLHEQIPSSVSSIVKIRISSTLHGRSF